MKEKGKGKHKDKKWPVNTPQAADVLMRYLSSFDDELEAKKKRLDELLGSNHWLSVGNYKENLLKELLINVLPKNLEIGTGFLIFNLNDELLRSKQIDLLIWDPEKGSPLFRDGDFVIIPSESCVAAIEVKTNLTAGKLKSGLKNLESVTRMIRAADQEARSQNELPYRAIFAFGCPKGFWADGILKGIRGHYGSYDIPTEPWPIESRISGTSESMVEYGPDQNRGKFRLKRIHGSKLGWINQVIVMGYGQVSFDFWKINDSSRPVYWAARHGKNGGAYLQLLRGLFKRIYGDNRSSVPRGIASLVLEVGASPAIERFIRIGDNVHSAHRR